MDEDREAIKTEAKAVSKLTESDLALTNSMARVDPAEQMMMQFSHSTTHTLCVAKANTSLMLNSAGRV
jgi:predicted ribonuclease toxin of YeeF-YezG toxin-antitoxin module